MLVKNGSTDVTTYFVLRDSTTHAPKADITVTDLDLYYVEELAAISSKADATALAAATTAHTENYAFNIGLGVYRVDWPDAAFDGGIGKKVQLIVVCSGVDTAFLEVELSPPVNVESIHSIDAGSVTTVNAHLGTTQAVLFTGSAPNTFVKTDMQSAVANSITASALATDAVTEIADGVLNRPFTAGVNDTNSRTLLQAARAIRNKWSVSGSTITFTKEDDTAPAWTSTIVGTSGANPVTSFDPVEA